MSNVRPCSQLEVRPSFILGRFKRHPRIPLRHHPSTTQHLKTTNMQIAEILSDLTSLRVCEYEAAIALVSSYETIDAHTTTGKETNTFSNNSTSRPKVSRTSSVLKDALDDLDLQRAMDLVDLHYGVKEKHKHGSNIELQKARQDVRRVIESMQRVQNTRQRDPRTSQH
ncbi:hypothetical protein MMC27_006448 [Xylographa pallens]|nr:hypothetical protein [Xylographa pallens]